MFQNANYDFIKWRWHAIFLSALVIVAGIVFGVTRGVPLGIDFSGGTIVVVKFKQPVSDDQVRQALVSAIPGEQVIQAYGDPSLNEKQIRIPQVISEAEGSLDQNAKAIVDALHKANLPEFEILSQDLVGPVIGADLQRRGVYATVL